MAEAWELTAGGGRAEWTRRGESPGRDAPRHPLSSIRLYEPCNSGVISCVGRQSYGSWQEQDPAGQAVSSAYNGALTTGDVRPPPRGL